MRAGSLSFDTACADSSIDVRADKPQLAPGFRRFVASRLREALSRVHTALFPRFSIHRPGMKLRPAFALELVFNLLLPWLVYRLAAPHFGDTGGLIASAAPPIVWSAIELARTRRIDALSVMVVAGIALSVGAMALGGSPRMLLMRESLVSGAVGVAFLASLATRRPLIFWLRVRP